MYFKWRYNDKQAFYGEIIVLHAGQIEQNAVFEHIKKAYTFLQCQDSIICNYNESFIYYWIFIYLTAY